MTAPLTRRPPLLRPTRARLGQHGIILTPRQNEVALLVAEGLQDREIAEVLVVSPRTVNSHVSSILRQLGFTRRCEIAAWAAVLVVLCQANA